LIGMTDTSRTDEAMSVHNRNVGGFELPRAGLWNIPSGWADIRISAPRILGSNLRTRMRLKQGTIAIADDPTHSTADISLDAAGPWTGDSARDRYLHDEVLNTGRYATIPVHVAAIQHCVGPNWKADGSITISGVSVPIMVHITYNGLRRDGAAAHFSARANVPLRRILPGGNGLRNRFLVGGHLRIAIEVFAEPVRASFDLQAWLDRGQRTRLADAA
jgi:polyisoprenoid-binding protein YceI